MPATGDTPTAGGSPIMGEPSNDQTGGAGSSAGVGAHPAGAGGTTAGEGGGASTGDAGDVGSSQSPLWTHAWDVRVKITPKNSQESPLCAQLAFTLAFPSTGPGLQTIAARDGESWALTLAPQADGSLIQIGSDGGYLPTRPSCGSVWSVKTSNLTLRVVGENLEGTASGVVTPEMLSDYAQPAQDVELSFSGTLDATAPALAVPVEALNPITRLSMSASEALASANVQLTGTSPPVALTLSAAQQGDALTQLFTEQVLPFSGSWQLSGSAADFAGHPLALGQTLTTLADPGIFAQDGFEGALNALLDAGATVSDDTATVKPITGSHSLQIQDSHQATLHLKRSAAQQNLVFSAVEFYVPNQQVPASGTQFGGYAAVVGGTHRSSLSWSFTVNSASTNQSNPTTVTVPLTDPGSDVVVNLMAPASTTGPYGPDGPHYAVPSLLIDDLHLE
jgi:hypothetical protein